MPKNSQVKRTIKLTIDKYLRTQDDFPEFKGLCAALLELSYNKASLVGDVLAEHYTSHHDIPTDVRAFRKILLSHLEDDMKTANVFVVDEFDGEEGGDADKAQVFVPSSLPLTTDDDQKGATLPDSALSAVDLTTAPTLGPTVVKQEVQPQSGGWFMNALWTVVTLGMGSSGTDTAKAEKGENPWAGLSENTQRVFKSIEDEVTVTGDATVAEDA